MFCEEIRIKQILSYMSFCLLRTLYNIKFILMATAFGTNAVVVMWIQCTSISKAKCLVVPDWITFNYANWWLPILLITLKSIHLQMIAITNYGFHSPSNVSQTDFLLFVLFLQMISVEDYSVEDYFDISSTLSLGLWRQIKNKRWALFSVPYFV